MLTALLLGKVQALALPQSEHLGAASRRHERRRPGRHGCFDRLPNDLWGELRRRVPVDPSRVVPVDPITFATERPGVSKIALEVIVGDLAVPGAVPVALGGPTVHQVGGPHQRLTPADRAVLRFPLVLLYLLFDVTVVAP